MLSVFFFLFFFFSVMSFHDIRCALEELCFVIAAFPGYSHIFIIIIWLFIKENKPFQIYWKIYHQKMKISR